MKTENVPLTVAGKSVDLRQLLTGGNEVISYWLTGQSKIKNLAPGSFVIVEPIEPRTGKPVLYCDSDGTTHAKTFKRGLVLVNDVNNGNQRFDNDGEILGVIRTGITFFSCLMLGVF